MHWKFDSSAPIYAQLVRHIQEAIVSGEFAPGDRLPSVRDMAMEAGVNPNTMQRALTELERDGLVYSQRTAGRFVTENTQIISETRDALADAHIRQFLSAMAHLGYERSSILTLLEQESEKEV